MIHRLAIRAPANGDKAFALGLLLGSRATSQVLLVLLLGLEVVLLVLLLLLVGGGVSILRAWQFVRLGRVRHHGLVSAVRWRRHDHRDGLSLASH